MKNIKFYNLFLFISTFTRNIIDVFMVIYLYKMGYKINDIIYIYILIYLMGIIISSFSLIVGNIIGYKYILILSSISNALCFYYLYHLGNIYFFSFLLSLSIFTYHPVKHYYGISLLKDKYKIGLSLILVYLAIFLSSFLIINNISYKYLIILSFIGILPILFMNKDKKEIIKWEYINKDRVRFFIFDQFKIIFLLLEPIYLFEVSKNIKFVGIFNIIVTFASVIYMYFISKRINIGKWYKYFNIFFVLVLLFKINISNKNFLLILAFLEGIGIKTNELISTINMYNNSYSKLGYIIKCEITFLIVRIIILSVFYCFNIKLIYMLYFLIFGIFILSFCYKKKESDDSL